MTACDDDIDDDGDNDDGHDDDIGIWWWLNSWDSKSWIIYPAPFEISFYFLFLFFEGVSESYFLINFS